MIVFATRAYNSQRFFMSIIFFFYKKNPKNNRQLRTSRLARPLSLTCLVLVVFMSKLLMNLSTWSLGSAGISAIVPGNSLGASSNIQGCLLICSTVYLLFGSSMSILRISDSQPEKWFVVWIVVNTWAQCTDTVYWREK